MKRKICVVITARPSYSRIRSALYAIQSHPDLELQLIISGSALLPKYGSAIDFILEDGFIPDAQIYHMIEGETLLSSAKSTGLAIIELSSELNKLQPDAVVTIADRYETLATAIAASYLNIPVVHIQGGEVTGSIDEKVRHAITKLSDIHFVSTNKAYERVISMGENPDSVYVTGCPSIDIAKQIDSNSPLDFNPFEKYGGVGNTFNTSEDYLIVMQHPITTEHYLSNNQTLETLEAITKLNMPTFWFWPNPDAGSAGISKEIRVFREHHEHSKIHFVINMSPEDFLKLTISSSCIIGNSSVAIRECSFLGVPAVNLGTRQFGRERGSNVIDSSHDSADIISAVKRQLSRTDITQDNLYGDGTAGEKIASILSECKFNISKTLLL
ncbi:MAG: UDP-N-acetylglucosamine 2-epimerase (hydrolyzing) [SAR202 cluster bacterium]|jgi:UDP-N-acetylglucosamine 2-epimerase/N-acetylmannosamine kinase|nr:UDP-N-acetylglucosamine 2-epimerase (hydrolyzing) [SAR202 cluster bacterium]|tara:strand:- start:6489 stop:7643 length:1155 start_codon:yes stop_codon:yes gene_type:complete